MTTDERITAVETRLDDLVRQLAEYLRHPVRQELTAMRDVHGARLAAIEARLTTIERDVSETESWMRWRFDSVDESLAAILALLRPEQTDER